MQVTMVKKRLPSGEPCSKCRQAEDMLRGRGLWGRIDHVVWAVEGDPGSEGMRLAQRFGVEDAPFFVVDGEGSEPKVFRSVLRFMRDGVAEPTPRKAAALEPRALEAFARDMEGRAPQEILRWGLERFGRDCALSFSGAEDVVLLDMAAELGLEHSVFCLDTGRLHPETYRFLDRVRAHYGVDLQVITPQTEALQAFVRTKGLFSFYEDGHQQCCGVRKVEPLRRVLGGYRAWVTGQRQDQSPATRAEVPCLQVDPAFEGRDGALVKLNPLAQWNSAQVWEYIRAREVPFNPLHERGFVSIGCEPCTRATLPGQHEREGRWWWESSADKECGLHSAAAEPPAHHR